MEQKDIAEELQETIVGEDNASEPLAEPAPPEKMLSVSRVNELIKKAKRDKEKQMQEQLDAAQQQIQQLQAQQQPQAAPVQQQQQQQQQAPQVDAQAIQAQIMEKLRQEMQEQQERAQQEKLQQEVNEVAQQYYGKMAQGKDIYDDFDAITSEFDPAAFPQLVYLATQQDNTPAIIYELQKNPGKLAQLAYLVDKSPAMARNEIAKLSQSIKTNEDAKRTVQNVQEPLNRMKSSPVGADGGGASTLRDYKNAPYLKA